MTTTPSAYPDVDPECDHDWLRDSVTRSEEHDGQTVRYRCQDCAAKQWRLVDTADQATLSEVLS